MDALLMEATPLKTPTASAFFVTLRNDGVLGSGTMDDPWDGSTIRYAASTGTASVEESSATTSKVTITMPSAHGFTNGDVVAIGGVTGAAEDYFEREFFVLVTSSTQFTFTIVTPPDGTTLPSSLTVGRVVYRFDLALKALPTATPTAATLYIGPGVFETRGTHGGWFNSTGVRQGYYYARPGHKIIGSGIDVTTLRVVVTEVPFAGHDYGALGGLEFNQLANGAEVSDLTVDCNLAAPPLRQAI